MKLSKIAVMSLALLFSAGATASACPNCKEALASQTGEEANLKDGYYYSIIMMIAAPFTMVGTGAFFVVRAAKKGMLPEL